MRYIDDDNKSGVNADGGNCYSKRTCICFLEERGATSVTVHFFLLIGSCLRIHFFRDFLSVELD